MKTIGIIGGMSWESTALYYQALNRGVKTKLGRSHSAKIAMISMNFQEIEDLQVAGKWDEAAAVLADAGVKLRTAGADFIVIATNTMHIVAPEVEKASGLPVLHIADATGAEIGAAGFKKVGLLGTAFTMEKDFYKGRLAEKFGLDVLVPEAQGRSIVHQIIYEELCKGVVRDSSRDAYLKIIDQLAGAGAEAIILGCTEIGMLVKPEHCSLPVLDTTLIHAEAAATLAVSKSDQLKC